jgi:hypothetical protein
MPAYVAVDLFETNTPQAALAGVDPTGGVITKPFCRVETDLLISTVPQHGERRCARLYQRHDGTLSSSGCQPSAQGAAKPWQFTIRSVMVIIAGCAAVLGFTKW